MKKYLLNIISVICVVFIIWFMLSFIDIVSDNSTKEPVHSPYNIFNLID